MKLSERVIGEQFKTNVSNVFGTELKHVTLLDNCKGKFLVSCKGYRSIIEEDQNTLEL